MTNGTLYTKSIDEVISNAKCVSSNINKRGVTVLLSHVEAIEELHEKYGKSKSCILRYITLHGLSILEHENRNQIVEIDRVRKNLRYTKNLYIKKFLWSLHIVTDDLPGGRIKRTLYGEESILSAIYDLSEKLNISISSFISILISYSLSTSEVVSPIIEESEWVKVNFQNNLHDLLDAIRPWDNTINVNSNSKEEAKSTGGI